MNDGEPAENGVAELVPAPLASGRHHPAHPQARADLLDVAVAARPGDG